MDSIVQALIRQVDTLAEQAVQSSSGASRLELLHTVRKLAIELEAEGDVVDRLAYQPVGNVVIRIAVELGIFDILVKREDPITTKELAEMTGADYTLLVRLMRNLAAIYAVDEVDTETFTASKISRAFTTPKGTSMARFFTDSRLPVWQKFPALLAERGYQNPSDSVDTALQGAHGANKTFWQTLNEHPDELRDYMTFMSSQREGRPSWLDFYPVDAQLIEGFSNVPDSVFFVDIGGAGGHECHALKAKYPDLPGRVVLQDLGGAIGEVKGKETKGIESMAHDFFQPQPIKGARTYYLRNILHDWKSPLCHTILRHLTTAMTPGYSKLLINEMVVPTKGASLFTVQSDFNMMVSLGGMERTEAQWRELLGAVGMEIERIWTSREDAESIIEVCLR